jgi:hypothetical protein
LMPCVTLSAGAMRSYSKLLSDNFANVDVGGGKVLKSKKKVVK